MNDNDIIKALECCVHQHCAECKLSEMTLCIDALSKYSLDLINRQKAKIERLKKRLEEEKHALFKQQAYTAKLQAENDEFREIIFTDRSEAIKMLKAEAIKEFAERLKGNCISVDIGDRSYKIITTIWIDNPVKEMTEGEDESDFEM